MNTKKQILEEFDEDPDLGGANEAKIPKLDIDKDIVANSFIVLFGRRGSGKSFLGRRIMKRFSDIPRIKIVCPSELVNGDYGKHIPGICIDDDYKSETLEKIFIDQTTMLLDIQKIDSLTEKYETTNEKYTKMLNKGLLSTEDDAKYRKYLSQIRKEIDELDEGLGNLKDDPRVLYVADDIMYKKDNPLKDEQFCKLVFNGRHYKITGLYMSQYPLGVPKNMRGCIDYVFILAEDSEMCRELLYDNYGKGVFASKHLFYKIMDHCTMNRRALVLKLSKTSDDGQSKTVATNDVERMKGKVFWYLADDVGNFKWPNKDLWRMHREYYDPDYHKKKLLDRKAQIENSGLKLPKKVECGVKIKLRNDDGPSHIREKEKEKEDPDVFKIKFIEQSSRRRHESDKERTYDPYRKKLSKILLEDQVQDRGSSSTKPR